MSSEGDVIYSSRVAELSKCQAEALCVYLRPFSRSLRFSNARGRAHVRARTVRKYKRPRVNVRVFLKRSCFFFFVGLVTCE